MGSLLHCQAARARQVFDRSAQIAAPVVMMGWLSSGEIGPPSAPGGTVARSGAAQLPQNLNPCGSRSPRRTWSSALHSPFARAGGIPFVAKCPSAGSSDSHIQAVEKPSKPDASTTKNLRKALEEKALALLPSRVRKKGFLRTWTDVAIPHPAHKRWLLSLTSLPTGRDEREGAGCGNSFFRSLLGFSAPR